LGSEEGLQKIARYDLVNFYETTFTPANAALVLAGDLTESEAEKLATDAFATWLGTGGASSPPQAGTPEPERVLIVDRAGTPQTFLLLGQTGVRRSDPDFEKLWIVNHVLGGQFSSRINLNLREK